MNQVSVSGINLKKVKRVILVAVTVSASSLVSFNIITGGFIVVLSVLVMGIFIYCYRDLSGHHIAWMVAVCSPLFRLIVATLDNGRIADNLIDVLPDSFFYITYGAVYALMFKYINHGTCTLNNFFYVAFLCDWVGNICEILIRSIIAGEMILNLKLTFILCIIAFLRTSLVQFINISIEYYTNFLLKQERDEMFKKLLVQASVFESEVKVMEKNVGEIEVVMRKAYDLHKNSAEDGVSKPIRDKLLDIAKSSHEIKGDYMGVISALKDVYLNELKDETMLFSEIISLEKQNVISLGRTRGCTVSVNVKIKTDYIVDSPFKLMSITRNIMTNAMEAAEGSSLALSVIVEEDSENSDMCRMTFADNGCGIERENLEFIRMEGYSTKFNIETGNIQRGLGLPVVYDIVENEYNGKIEIDSEVNKGTVVTIFVPEAKIGGKRK